MLNFDDLTAKVDAIAAVLPNITADYAELKAEIETLSGQLDPTAQAKLDELVAKLDVSFDELTALDETVPVHPVEPPVEPPVV